MPNIGPATRKVVVLGGGMAALSAAYQLALLNQDPTRPLRYEITVYQQGWRLGGKCASGRNAKLHDRIEEHGLHIWFGAYENAFRMMRGVYTRTAEQWPNGELMTAFRKQRGFHLAENRRHRWLPWHFPMSYPEREEMEPGDGNEQGYARPRGILRLMGRWVAGFFRATVAPFFERASTQGLDGGRPPTAPGQPLDPARLDQLWEGSRIEAVENASQIADGYRRFNIDLSGKTGELLRSELALREGGGFLDELRRGATIVSIALAVLAGVLRSEAYREDDWDLLNGSDLRDWLRGQLEGIPFFDLGSLADSPLVTATYSLFFSFPGGAKQGRIEAGSALRAAVWLLFTFKGSFMWRMNTGMGDAILAPIYHALHKMGVEFRFFHKVTALRPGTADPRTIGSIEIERQATMNPGYRLFVRDAQGCDCWPSYPDFANLQEGNALEAGWDHYDLESDWSDWQGPGRVTLHAGSNFDHVVLGIPIAALVPICADLAAAQARFQSMLDHVKTVQTQAAQLWLSSPLSGLDPGAAKDTELRVMTTLAEPMDTYSDMSYLIAREGWTGPQAPQHLAYFCGVLPETQAIAPHASPQYPSASRTEVKRYGRGLLDGSAGGQADEPPMHALWPRAYTNAGFRWDLLCGSIASGSARLEDQYWRANVDASERYVLALPGTSRYRLKAHDSGWQNLALAGDWIANGLYLGCVEGAVISGIQAARAVSKEPIEIVGEGTLFLKP